MWSTSSTMSSVSSNAGSGGFFHQDENATPSPSFSQQTDGSRGRSRAQTIIPMSIAQIYAGMDAKDTLKFADNDVNVVTIVGLIISMDQQTTHVQYLVDDMTAKPPLKVQIWVDESNDNDRKKPMVENTYVRVFGSIKKMRGEIIMVAFKMYMITNLSELSMHLTEVIHAKYVAEVKLKEKQNESFNGGNTTSADTQMDFETSGAPSGLNKIQTMIFKTIQASKDFSGCNLNTIMDQLKSLNPTSVRDGLSFLLDEGHIYTTVDDTHYKVTDSF